MFLVTRMRVGEGVAAGLRMLLLYWVFDFNFSNVTIQALISAPVVSYSRLLTPFLCLRPE